MTTKTRTMSDLYNEVRENMHNKMQDGIGINSCGADLHYYLCNEDYFIIGRYNAVQFMGEYAWQIIEMVKNYEQDNFGEVNTDLSDPERVCNMFAYIVGEQFLSECHTLSDAWDDDLNEETHTEIMHELGDLNPLAVYNRH